MHPTTPISPNFCLPTAVRTRGRAYRCPGSQANDDDGRGPLEAALPKGTSALPPSPRAAALQPATVAQDVRGSCVGGSVSRRRPANFDVAVSPMPARRRHAGEERTGKVWYPRTGWDCEARIEDSAPAGPCGEVWCLCAGRADAGTMVAGIRGAGG